MLSHRVPRIANRISALAAACLFGMAAAGAHAETGSAAADDLGVHINLLGIAQLDVDPQAPASVDNASAPAYDANALPSLDIGGPLLHLSTGTISSEAEYRPLGSLSASTAAVSLENVDLSAVSGLGADVLSIHANLIRSRSRVVGYCLPTGMPKSDPVVDDITFYNGFDVGNLDGGGPNGDPDPTDIVLDGLGISILGIPLPDLPLNPPPNTAIDLAGLGIAGATLILNEQTLGGDGITTRTMSANALHLTLNTIGLVTADVVLGHSDAKLDCTQ